jgi:hypothetical protein
MALFRLRYDRYDFTTAVSDVSEEAEKANGMIAFELSKLTFCSAEGS